MEIKTKYNIGDTLWFIDERRVMSGVVLGVKAYINTTNKGLKYETKYEISENYYVISEEECFLTKEELIKSL